MSRPTKVIAVVGAVAIAGALALTAMITNLGSPPTPGSSVIVVGRNTLIDQSAPDFTLQTLDDQTVSLSALRGKPVIVNFWASWCVPCREEFPLLVAANQKYADRGLQIVSILHDDNVASATQFAQSYGATWPLAVDPDQVAWQAYKGSLLPISYYIDREGIVRAVSYGPPPSGFLDDQITQIL